MNVLTSAVFRSSWSCPENNSGQSFSLLLFSSYRKFDNDEINIYYTYCIVLLIIMQSDLTIKGIYGLIIGQKAVLWYRTT
jgi:hypothetical protein